MSKFNVVKQNQAALSASLQDQAYKSGRPRCCWKCQQNKQIAGGSMTTWPGLSKFICKECVDKTKAEHEKAQ